MSEFLCVRGDTELFRPVTGHHVGAGEATATPFQAWGLPSCLAWLTIHLGSRPVGVGANSRGHTEEGHRQAHSQRP